jgi:hypothetical protein
VLDGFADILPDRAKLARLRPELTAGTRGSAERAPARPAAPGRKRAAKAKGRARRKR